MRCARCGRLILRDPAATIGGRVLGPKCAKAMGLIECKPRKPSLFGRLPVKRDTQTGDLFAMDAAS